MKPLGAVLLGAVAAAVALVAWLLLVGLPRWYGPQARVATRPLAAAPARAGRKIKARLFYVADDGLKLVAVERDVPYGEGPSAQAQEIIAAQIAPVSEPLVSAVPPGTKLRALYVTERGTAYVDVTHEISAGHSGGSTDELLTVYTIVNAVTANLPAITAVQLLVDGKEVETLAGHVDLRRPLTKNLGWVQ